MYLLQNFEMNYGPIWYRNPIKLLQSCHCVLKLLIIISTIIAKEFVLSWPVPFYRASKKISFEDEWWREQWRKSRALGAHLARASLTLPSSNVTAKIKPISYNRYQFHFRVGNCLQMSHRYYNNLTIRRAIFKIIVHWLTYRKLLVPKICTNAPQYKILN